MKITRKTPYSISDEANLYTVRNIKKNRNRF